MDDEDDERLAPIFRPGLTAADADLELCRAEVERLRLEVIKLRAVIAELRRLLGSK